MWIAGKIVAQTRSKLHLDPDPSCFNLDPDPSSFNLGLGTHCTLPSKILYNPNSCPLTTTLPILTRATEIWIRGPSPPPPRYDTTTQQRWNQKDTENCREHPILCKSGGYEGVNGVEHNSKQANNRNWANDREGTAGTRLPCNAPQRNFKIQGVRYGHKYTFRCFLPYRAKGT